jgi:phospholipid/cholesterol/gamma-HCH transport system substrate-binding protein
MRRLAAIFGALVAAATAIGVSSSQGAGGPYLVRAIFDNAGFAVPGEDVRISGAPVGSIQSLAVTADKQAAVTLAITDSRFTPFHANATCAIRPQSLIGERYVDCEPGNSSAPTLTRIQSGQGAGAYYLPVTQTSSPVDSDIVQDIYQEPIRERFALILNELGTGLAARGSDLNAVIHRANPALGYTDQVLKILAQENRVLAQLATDSDTVLGPLARVKSQLAEFVVQANTTSVASAARAADISRSFQLLPEFLRQLQPLLADLGTLADQGTPLMAELSQSAGALGRQFQNLTPFANAARPALIELGKTSAESEPALVATEPLARQLRSLGSEALPPATTLARLTSSLDQTGAIEQLMALLFYGTSAANGFDTAGHFVRAEPLVGQCTAYVKTSVLGCSANFNSPGAAADVRSPQAAVQAVRTSAVPVSPSKAVRVARQAVRAVTVSQQGNMQVQGLISYLFGSSR